MLIARDSKFIKASHCVTLSLSEWSEPNYIKMVQSLNPGLFIDINSDTYFNPFLSTDINLLGWDKRQENGLHT